MLKNDIHYWIFFVASKFSKNELLTFFLIWDLFHVHEIPIICLQTNLVIFYFNNLGYGKSAIGENMIFSYSNLENFNVKWSFSFSKLHSNIYMNYIIFIFTSCYKNKLKEYYLKHVLKILVAFSPKIENTSGDYITRSYTTRMINWEFYLWMLSRSRYFMIEK